jgi:hypothetical protein
MRFTVKKKKKKDESWKRGVSDREHERLKKKYSGTYLPTPGQGQTVVIFIRKKQ